MKNKDLAVSAKKKVILYSKSDLGLDMNKFLGEEIEKSLDPLNTVLVAYPTANSLQLIGRIGRENRGETALIIHPLVEDWYARSAFTKCFQKVYQNMERIKTMEEIKGFKTGDGK